MKKRILPFFLLMLTASLGFSQWNSQTNGIYYQAGDVAIGHSSPATRLHVQGPYEGGYGQMTVQANQYHHAEASISSVQYNTIAQLGLRNLGTNKAWYISARWGLDSNVPADRLQWYFANGGSTTTPFTLMSSGRVGFGTQNPDETLHIYSNASNRRAMIKFQNTNAAYGTKWRMGSESGNGHPAGTFMLYREDAQGNVRVPLKVEINGQVVLGTQLVRQNTNEPPVKVIGELCVSTNGVCPDYVFEETYEHMPLEDLDTYLKENKHLPGVKSAKEIEDQGGVNMVELSYSMLEKIEELTLYTLDQQAEIEELKTLVRSQAAQLNDLQTQQ